MDNKLQATQHDFIIYKDYSGNVKVNVMLINHDLWLTQDLIAELRAESHNAMTMKDWIEKLNAFLQFNGQDILNNTGKISQKVAQELAYKEYEKFKVKQDELYKTDFDLLMEEMFSYEGSGCND